MSEEKFDMNQCKEGDKLVSSLGMIFKYIRKTDDQDFPHIVMYPNGAYGMRTDDGFVSNERSKGIYHDIVGFVKTERLAICGDTEAIE